MNRRLREQQASYKVEITTAGEILVPNAHAKIPVMPLIPPLPRPEPLPHPTGPLMLRGREMSSKGSYADIFPELIKHAKPGKGPGWIIHAGACRGEETVKLYTTYWRSIIALEPDPRNIDILRSRLADVQQSHPFPLKAYPFAVGDQDGRAILRQSNNIDGTPWPESNTIKDVKLHKQQSPELNWDATVEVGMTTLDTLWKNLGEPFVFMLYSDVEGAEKEMLAGAQKMLKRTRWVFTEWSKSERYAGALGLDETMKMLPGNWDCCAVFDHGHFGDLLALNNDVPSTGF